MFSFLKILIILIKIDQETVLNWFGIEDPEKRELRESIERGFEFNLSELEPSPDVSFETFRLLIEGLCQKVQEGLTLADIENIVLFILFIRFIILALRYNLKTAFYITIIGLLAGYLWYRHFIDLISAYRNVIAQLPFLHKLGMDAIQLRAYHRQMAFTDFKLGDQVHWYNPGLMLYYAFTKGIIHIDPESGLRYYIDPISMLVSKLGEPIKSKVIPLYYDIYNLFIPKVYDICSQYWNQLSGLVGYTIITRMGKRYCPYLIRWHWTFLLMIGLVEPMLLSFIYRISYFQARVLIPQVNPFEDVEGFEDLQGFSFFINYDILLQVNILNAVITALILAHMGLVLFGLFHAICGQYFYMPFFVENTELHVGPRPKNSIYSGGNTAWQEPEEKEKTPYRLLPKLWYGWFGRGTKGKSGNRLIQLLKKILKKLRKKFRR